MGGGLLRREAILELVQSRRHPGRRPRVQTPTTNGRGSISFFYYIFDISDDFHEINSDIYKLKLITVISNFSFCKINVLVNHEDMKIMNANNILFP